MQRHNSGRLVIIAVLTLVAGALWWWRRGDDATTGERVRGNVDVPSQRAPAVSLRGSAREVPPVVRASGRPVRLTAAAVTADATLPFGSFEGRVVNLASERPVEGAEVTFSFAQQTAAVTTDASGRFQFEPPGLGDYRLAVAQASGYLPYAPDWGQSPIELTARRGLRITGITVYLSPAIDYTGVVVDSSGAPVAGAAVRLLAGGEVESKLVPIADRFTSDERGEFVFHARDFSVLAASHPQAGWGRAVLDGAAQISHRLTIALRAEASPPREVIAGRVTDAAGVPLEGVRIAATRQSPPGPERLDDDLSKGQARTDTEGEFRIEELEPGAYLVSAIGEGYAVKSVETETGQEHLAIQLDEGARVIGTVLAAGTRDPVPAFTVVVLAQRGPLRQESVLARSIFDGEGKFDIGGLPEGSFLLAAHAYGFAPSEPMPAQATRSPSESDRVEIALSAGGKLVGQVLDAESKAPLFQARVIAEGSVGSGPSALPMVSTTVTDENGKFELSGLAPGLRSVNVAAFEHHSRILSGLQVTDGAMLGPVTVELTATKEGERPQLEMAGLGVSISAGEDGLVINRVFPGGGGEEAGLVAGDTILAVEGAAVVDLGFQAAIERIRGPVGSRIALRVRKTEGGEVRDLIAVRRKVRT